MTYEMKIYEWDDGKRSAQEGGIGPHVILKFKPDVTGFQVRALGKHIKRVCDPKVKVVVESEEEVSEIK